MDRERVLFLCTGNSARSQMAEALLRRLAGDRYDVYSAGLEPKGVHPLTIKVLEEMGIQTDILTSKPLTTYLGKVHFSYLITVCGNAEERCPIFPGMGMRLYWPFEDPAAFEGSEEARLDKFRQVRDAIEAQLKNWLST
ncbi:MAG: arsenate reductase ArsC [Anaerolineaceae bacterium]|nr:arsenate reductase ArsC [Anaerolineaceae bacterium]NTV36300.1 arsenate reductase ArsC [Anaerolineaceae bacterium]